MTRDGLVEKNLATGEETRVSQRGQDFELRQKEPEAGHSFDPQARPTGSTRHQPPPVEQSPTADIRQDTYAPDGSEYSPSSQYSHSAEPPPRPMEAARPTARAYESRSHEAPAGPKPRPKQADFSTRNATFEADTATPHETPSGAAAARHSPENPLFQHQNGTENVPNAPHPPDTGKGRLKFTGEQRAAQPRTKAKQRGTKYSQQFSQDAVKPEDTGKTPADSAQPPPSSRLQFTADELPPDKKLSKLQQQSDKNAAKLEKARGKLPTKKRMQTQRVYDEAKGKAKTKLTLEKEVLPPGSKPDVLPVKAGKMAGRGVTRAGTNKLHQKISEVEHENVGVKAVHKVEQTAENTYRGGRTVRSAYRFVKERPYRRVAKLEKQAMKTNIKLDYRKALQDNPKLKSNVLSRMLQKQKIKRQYAKAAREAQKAAGRAAKKTGEGLAAISRAVIHAVKSHPAVFATIGALALLIIIIMSSVTSCSNMGMGGMGAVLASSYLAEDADMDNAELAYTEWETDLQMQVDNAERDHPGFDEYRYNVDDISHDPYELMAFLTAAYQDFSYSDIQAVLRQIFEQQYQLSFEEETEIRTRTVTGTRSTYDPITGDYTGEEEYEYEEEYEWHILNINLTARSFTDIVAPLMTSDQREIYDLLMETKGNRQYAYSPFDFNWLPYISCYYGYRVHPISGEKDYHKAIDIAVAQGTEIIAAHDGTVTTATWHDSYGYYIALDDGESLVTKYAHCSQLLVSAGQQVQKGDVIAKVGSTGDSTGPHLHFEVIKNGQYLNPLYFSETNDDGSGNLPPGTPGGPEIPAYPGAPMGDGTYAALMEEAQKHLGKPYVFGAKGPDKFDCSGFVSWSLTHSGVKNINTNAQGLYNASTPVSRDNAQPGDLIFFHSTYSTSNTVTHVGIYIGNGQMIHAGKPVQYSSIDTRYWQEHFYAFGRIN